MRLKIQQRRAFGATCRQPELIIGHDMPDHNFSIYFPNYLSNNRVASGAYDVQGGLDGPERQRTTGTPVSNS